MKNFHCRQCGSCCEMIPSLFEVSRRGDLEALYRYVQDQLQGLLWSKIRVQTFSEFLYYVRDFSTAKEQLATSDPGCPFLIRHKSQAKCIVQAKKPTGCKTFPETMQKAYELTLDCRGWG